MNTQIYGIRHHGPGSARRLLDALALQIPDIILIEAPQDAENLMPYLKNNALQTPVAMLLYDKSDLSCGSYYPFADFSPEWQAMKFAIQNEIEIQFMDLPQGIRFAKRKQDAADIQLALPEKQEKSKVKENLLQHDPMKYLAQLAGYQDSERWWEVTFESQFEEEEIFPAISSLIGELRSETKESIDSLTLLREAYMRKVIRAAAKKGRQNAAIVCGAWHAPALQSWQSIKAVEDNKILRGHKKIKIAATWIPWTFQRLAFQSGYGAGVTSPTWYQLLFDSPKDAVIKWMALIAQLFRVENMDASSAHVIEAVRLAQTLATIRAYPVPGIAELREAAITILCGGDEKQFEWIEEKLLMGSQMGIVGDEIPKIPLQLDIEKNIKSVRLSKLWGSSEKVSKSLDLRKSAQLKASILLHRLKIVGIPYGEIERIQKGSSAGAFSEHWNLQWQPDFMLQIIEAAMWGNTVEDAAYAKILDKKEHAQSLMQLTNLVEQAFNADLGKSMEAIIDKIKDVSVSTQDIYQLMEALPPLVSAMRYGSTKNYDTHEIKNLIDSLVPRICVALKNNCINIDDDAAELMYAKIQKVNRAIFIINDMRLMEMWLDALQGIYQGQQINPLIKGASTRILFDKEQLPFTEIEKEMSLTLSPAFRKGKAARWLEGFLSGSGLLIIHNPSLWNIINAWVESIEMERFIDVLPLLRRTFAEFSPSEREKMMLLAKKGNVKEENRAEATELLNKSRIEKVTPILEKLLF